MRAHIEPLPPVLAGPILRRVDARRLVLWLVASQRLEITLTLESEADDIPPLRLERALGSGEALQVGQHAWIQQFDVELEDELPSDTLIHYDLRLPGTGGGLADWAPHLLYPGQHQPSFVRRGRLDHLLHGSCRRPHHHSRDGLWRVDQLLGATLQTPHARPTLLLMTGDQIYADDVAGPMLVAIHRLIERLGLYGEQLAGAQVADSAELYAHPATYYRREDLLPAYDAHDLRERFFGGVRKPVFTTASAQNHLVTLAEMLAMYLLVWSPLPWRLIEPTMPALPEQFTARYRREAQALEAFVADLPLAARALAQCPCLMIFDDHDVTDDWNLSAHWEDVVYNHPFSRRIVGNALVAYWLCQGWGNAPELFGELLRPTRTLLAEALPTGQLPADGQDLLIDRLLLFKRWHYCVRGQPTLLVLDTRTRRWRREHHLYRPSGLLDWEALSELQNDLFDESAVVIVSPAPMFGVKLIEAIQRLFTWAGHPLMVDAENWMAHRGAAKTMLNIFRHSRTPANYVVLSGDVHYSFVYRVVIRSRPHGPNIWQVTSSGIKNEFPPRLLDWFDRLNRWLYSPHSPLNWFTKRRPMEITPYLPDRRQHGERVWNGAGIGQLRLDEHGRPLEIRQLNADGSADTRFLAPR